jgi:NADH dehydrogenase FAD-containing subunit
VKSIQPGVITLADEEVIEAENILWGAGVMANPLTRQLGTELYFTRNSGQQFWDFVVSSVNLYFVAVQVFKASEALK